MPLRSPGGSLSDARANIHTRISCDSLRNPNAPTGTAKAMEVATSADLHTLIDLLFSAEELRRLADLIAGTPDQALQDASHFATEPAARSLEDSHPELSARLWRAQGMQIVDAGKASTTTPPWRTSSRRNVATSVRA